VVYGVPRAVNEAKLATGSAPLPELAPLICRIL
jgi:hypothetical protein